MAFRLNDKIMQVRNNYEKEVFNGDSGRITSINPESQEVIATFDKPLVPYDTSELDEIVPQPMPSPFTSPRRVSTRPS